MTARPAQPSPAPPLLSLQVLRAVAALLVLAHHAGYDADTIASRTGVAPLGLDRWFDGAFGIHLFFVISGFIMLRTARGFGSARGAAGFMLRRILRVVPLYWLLTTLVMVGAALAPGLLNRPPGGSDIVVGSYLFIPLAGANGELRIVLGQGWTLDYEMFFYALFALAMLLPRPAALGALATGLVGLVVAGRAAVMPAGPLAVWTDGLLLEFLFGLALGLAQERGWRLTRVGATAAVFIGCAAAAAAMARGAGAFAPWIAGGIPAAAVVGGCVLGPRWPATRGVMVLALVGDASYSLYLSHPFVVRLLREAWFAAEPRDGAPGAFLVLAMVAAVGASLLLYRSVERPMTAWLQRRIGVAGGTRRPILPDVVARETLPRR